MHPRPMYDGQYSGYWRGKIIYQPVGAPNYLPVRLILRFQAAITNPTMSVVYEVQTHLELDDIELWRNVGLTTEPGRSRTADDIIDAGQHNVDGSIWENSICNQILWLFGKAINYTTAGDGLTPADFARPQGQRLPIGITQELILQKWSALDAQLQQWYDELPPTFQPCERRPLASRASSRNVPGHLEEVYYSIPMCAAAMQSYHMARILILVNRPHESTAIRSTITERLDSYRKIQEAVLRHGREICGISLANPPPSVRVHSIQPLFVAGESFHTPEERQVVMQLLNDIEQDVGWSTKHYREKLAHEWNNFS